MVFPQKLLKASTKSAGELLRTKFCKIWKPEAEPADWRDSYLSALSNTRNMQQCAKWNKQRCGNYRRIMLLLVPSKLLGRIMLRRLGDAEV